LYAKEEKMKKIVFCTLMVLAALALWAQELDEAEAQAVETSEIAEEQAAEPAKSGPDFSHSITAVISTLPEAKVQYAMNWKYPFMKGSNPLTSGNNLKLTVMPELAPVFLYLNADAAFTPIAFLVLNLGGMAGTGWNIKLFGNDLYGMGVNAPAGDPGKGFDGVFLTGRASATVQMDIGAVIPGDWNHVLFQSKHEINYRYYSAADADDAWYREADRGENVNGLNYYGNITLGYQMPLFLKMVAFQIEFDKYLNYGLGDARKVWGDDLIRLTYGPVLQFNFKGFESFNAVIATQFRSMRYTATGDRYYDLDNYYRYRTFKENKFEFYRAAFILSFGLK
jgi:hypothetical protein